MEKFVVVFDDKVINYINDDVALSILSKLSFKSLKRFECVHKSWSLLFDNPTFMTLYRRNFFSKCSYDDDTSLILHIHGHKKLHSLSGEGFENIVELDWPNQMDRWIYLGFGCVNGILCFEDPIWHKIVLWNPSINELKVIRSSPFESFIPPATLNFGASVHYSIIPNLHGFGYDCVGDDYKFIRNTSIKPKLHIFQPSGRDLKLARDKSLKSFWEIYSLKNNSWKKLEIDMPSCSKYNSGFGTFRVYLDGVCHWLNLNRNNNYDEASLISFDLNSEAFINTPIPSFAGECCTGLSVLNDSIALFTYDHNIRTFEISTFDISVLGEIGAEESWYKLLTVGPLPWFEIPIGVGKKGEIFFKKRDNEFVWFDFNTNTVKHLGFKAGRVFHQANPGCRMVIRSSPFESFIPPATLNFGASVCYSIIHNLHGFGYDCVGDDYKFIRNTSIRPKLHIFQPSGRDLKLARDKSLNPFWEIYSLKNNSWKKIEIDMPSCSKYNSGFETFRVYLDGVCHWLNLNRNDNYDEASLISFDLSSEVFINIPIPSFAGECCTRLSVLNDSIVLFTYHHNMRTFEISTFDISVLSEIGAEKSWYKLLTIESLPWFEIPIGVGKKGEIFFKKRDNEFVWFDVNTNTVKHFGFKVD
ncbi:unnamed protein product [Vicia faba]|uniref:F-box domain-containing protein n=1 Tax=Vicia faba TaxID=3906 RepID=A0AAV1B3W3_VICFA|nr:unnamed protein product [Vicia faba]